MRHNNLRQSILAVAYCKDFRNTSYSEDGARVRSNALSFCFNPNATIF